MKKCILILLTLCFLSCRNQTNDIERKKNKLLKKEFEDRDINFNDLDFSINLIGKDENNRPSKFEIKIIRKNRIFQNIVYCPDVWPVIGDSLNINKIDYFDSKSIIKEGIENYHDFIIADFNFDNRKDFAILYDYGGNAGPIYSYFFQNSYGNFSQREKFPLNKSFFPKEMNKTNKSLIISRPLGCCKIITTTFQLQKDKWQKISEAIK